MQQTGIKINARCTTSILTKDLEQTYYFSLFFGKKQHYFFKNNTLHLNFMRHRNNSLFLRQFRQRRIVGQRQNRSDKTIRLTYSAMA